MPRKKKVAAKPNPGRLSDVDLDDMVATLEEARAALEVADDLIDGLHPREKRVQVRDASNSCMDMLGRLKAARSTDT